MLKLEVLCATMHQKDFSKIKEMNIKSDVIFANQAENNRYDEHIFDRYTAQMITTDLRGVGINRNLAILNSSADILLFSDDDINYIDDYENGIIKAFLEFPNADVIIFSCNLTKNGKTFKTIKNKIKHLNLFNSLKYGTYVIAVRRNIILKNNIWFSLLFGGGAIYSAGEDSLFLIDCFKKSLNVYSHDFIIGNCSKDKSSWFTGYNEKYFFDKGAWISCAFPKIKYLLILYFIYKYIKKSQIKLDRIFKLMIQGIKGFNQTSSYYDYKKSEQINVLS